MPILRKGDKKLMTTFNDYQSKAKRTDKYPANFAFICYALGLSSEAGEVAGKIKKLIRDKSSNSVVVCDCTDKESIIDELGDCLWYIAMMAGYMGYTMEDVAFRNIEKLADRERRGKIGGSGDNR